jgi:hypothetical protein
LPAISWSVAAADGSKAAPVLPAAATGKAVATTDETASRTHRGWILATLLFAALWLGTLVWAFHHRAHHAVVTSNPAQSQAEAHGRDAAKRPLVELKRALDSGDLGEVADVLCAMAAPAAADLDHLLTRLADPAQREAIDALQRARWGGGDGVRARQLLRDAFAKGPRWRAVDVVNPSPLPPLYPARDSTDTRG